MLTGRRFGGEESAQRGSSTPRSPRTRCFPPRSARQALRRQGPGHGGGSSPASTAPSSRRFTCRCSPRCPPRSRALAARGRRPRPARRRARARLRAQGPPRAGDARERQVNDGVLYPLLARLEERGLTRQESESGPGPGPPRRVFHATAAGKRAFGEWLRSTRGGLRPRLRAVPRPPSAQAALRLPSEPAGAMLKVASLRAAAEARLGALDDAAALGGGSRPRSARSCSSSAARASTP